MKKYLEFRKDCIYRNNKLCTYWFKQIQCHLLSCPLFSPSLSKQEKKIIKKKLIESVVFNVEDFEKNRTTSHDLIKNVREDDLIQAQTKRMTKEAIMVQGLLQRMVCIVCGEPITDDKYSTIRDPSNTLIYIHSKGKCKPRKDGIPKIRQEWLESHTSKDP